MIILFLVGAVSMPYPMQRLQRLLLHRLHMHRPNLRAADRFEYCRNIRTISLVAPDVGTEILRRQQRNTDAALLQSPRPMMRRGARLHDYVRRARARQIPLELQTTEPAALDDPPLLIR